MRYWVNRDVLEVLRQGKTATTAYRGRGKTFTLLFYIAATCESSHPLIAVPRESHGEHLRRMWAESYPDFASLVFITREDQLRGWPKASSRLYADECRDAELWAERAGMKFGGGVHS